MDFINDLTFDVLIKLMADYGHGVMNPLMLESLLERDKLHQYVGENEDLFASFHSEYDKDDCFYKLTPKGLRHFKGKSRYTSSKTWAHLLDISMMSAYMLMIGEFSDYRYCPHFTVEVGNKKVGLISHVWGINRDYKNLDVLLVTPRYLLDALNEKHNLEWHASELGISQGAVKEVLKSATIPHAFRDRRISDSLDF